MSESSTIIREIEAQERLHIQQTFREAAQAATQIPLFFIDPTRLNDDPQHNLEVFKEQFREQFPDREIPWTDEKLVEEMELEDLLQVSRIEGPFAINPEIMEADFCLMNDIGQFFEEDVTTGGINLTTKEGIVSFLTDVEPDELHPISGTTGDYIPYVADHEIKHCEQPSETETIEKESGADKFALSRADPAVAQEIRDARAYDAPGHTNHATNILSQSDNIAGEDIEAHRDTIRAMAEEIDVRMAREFGEDTAYFKSDIEDAEDIYDNLGSDHLISEILRLEDRGLYHDTIDRMLADGAFDDDPLLKEYIEDQQVAARRLVNVDVIGFNDGPDTAVEQNAIEYIENDVLLDDDGNPIRDDVSLPERDENGRIRHEENGDIILGDSVNEIREAQAQDAEQEVEMPEVEIEQQAANTAEESHQYSDISFEQQSTGNELENITPQLAETEIKGGTINATLTTVFEENVLAANDDPITELQQPALEAAPTALAFTA